MSSQSQGSTGGTLMTLAVLTLIILVAVWYINLPGNASFGRRLGDALEAAPRVVAHAADKLTGHETVTHETVTKADETTTTKVNEAKTKVSQATTKVDTALKKTGDAASSAAVELGNDIKAAVDEQKKQSAAHKPDRLRTSTTNQTE